MGRGAKESGHVLCLCPAPAAGHGGGFMGPLLSGPQCSETQLLPSPIPYLHYQKGQGEGQAVQAGAGCFSCCCSWAVLVVVLLRPQCFRRPQALGMGPMQGSCMQSPCESPLSISLSPNNILMLGDCVRHCQWESSEHGKITGHWPYFYSLN